MREHMGTVRGGTEPFPAVSVIESEALVARLARVLLSPLAVALADVVALVLAATFVVRFRPGALLEEDLGAAVLLTVLFALVWLRGAHLWQVRAELGVLDELPGLVVAGFVPTLIVFFLASLVGAAKDPVVFAELAVALAIALVAERTLLRMSQRWLRRKGYGCKATLIVGAGHVGSLIAQRLLRHAELGLRPIGFVDKDPLADSSERSNLPILGSSYQLASLLEEHDVKAVVVAFSTAPHSVMLNIVRTCQEKGVELAVVPRLFETITTSVGFEQIRGIPVIGVRGIRLSGLGWWLKRLGDILVGGTILVLCSPVLAAIALAVKLDTPGPVFYMQERAGRDGASYWMYKFRTLRADAEARTGEMWSDALESDRGREMVTRTGRLLRVTSLDELPQLVNVVKGEMSLVGPRPERPLFVNQFVHDIYRYGDRMRVKAGMTGWAQVHGLNGNNGSLAERVEYDNFYIENWSPWLDVRIMLMTLQQIYRDLRGLD